MVIVDKYEIEILPQDLWRLTSNIWINDQIVNFYICMLKEKYRECFFFDSHWYGMLTARGTKYQYHRAANWTSKVSTGQFFS